MRSHSGPECKACCSASKALVNGPCNPRLGVTSRTSARAGRHADNGRQLERLSQNDRASSCWWRWTLDPLRVQIQDRPNSKAAIPQLSDASALNLEPATFARPGMPAARLPAAFTVKSCTPEAIQVCGSLQLKSDQLHARCRLGILLEEFPADTGFDRFEGSPPQGLVNRKVTREPAFLQSPTASAGI